jgi:hypothetical protein
VARLEMIEDGGDAERSGILVEARCTGCGFTELIPIEYLGEEGDTVIDATGVALGICSGCCSGN